jgi:hypothetical protein
MSSNITKWTQIARQNWGWAQRDATENSIESNLERYMNIIGNN